MWCNKSSIVQTEMILFTSSRATAPGKLLHPAPEVRRCRYRSALSLHSFAGGFERQDPSFGPPEEGEQVKSCIHYGASRIVKVVICNNTCDMYPSQNIGIEDLRTGQCGAVTNHEAPGRLHERQYRLEM